MAMLRLAKMALHGQGCEANTLAAQARALQPAAPRRAPSHSAPRAACRTQHGPLPPLPRRRATDS